MVDFSGKSRYNAHMEALTEETAALLAGLAGSHWLRLAGLALAASAASFAARSLLRKAAFQIPRRRSLDLPEDQERRFLRPVGLVAFAAVWVAGLPLLGLSGTPTDVFVRTGKVALAVGFSVFSYHLVDYAFFLLEHRARRSRNTLDDLLVPFLRKSAKLAAVVVGAVVTGNALTLNMTNVIAGLGIGGLAFAFAAKDAIANLFGSLTIILDRPFRIGDWVVVDGGTEGTVEEVGVRSTRIRTFYDSLVSVPNGALANLSIDNYGSRTYRRLSTTVGLQYDTPPDKVEAFCEGVRDVIRSHPRTRKDYFHVYLNGLGGHSLDVMLYVFWRVPDWSTELAERHRLLVDVLRLGADLGVEFAFPTQTLHLFDETPRADAAPRGGGAPATATAPPAAKEPRP